MGLVAEIKKPATRPVEDPDRPVQVVDGGGGRGGRGVIKKVTFVRG